ncbi:hypothetical protein NLJ89_g10066 [Agrocybe chaxingu]|uniref:CSC1/OSCA1-like 7TM region domain-containing protein n=1 Tax=Agrocybe chaxingu TaxID=84603 RepID=A0A9W8JUU0_9AGAR|nr:hypothetical protein NLJ89_g10066 [Agrocybe chaxingu]
MPTPLPASSPDIYQQLRVRPRHDITNDPTTTTTTPATSAGDTNPTSTPAIPPNTSPFPSASDPQLSTTLSQNSGPSQPGSGSGPLVFTTTVAVTTVTEPTTTFTSFSQSVFTQGSSPSSASATTSASSGAASQLGSTVESICPGDGVDGAAAGMLAAIILPGAIGFILWLIFAIVRPRFRQIYALREWFVQQDLRPKPLGSSFFAFLFPKVPLVPDIPSDVSDAGRSAAQDAKLFPSDEEMSQRALWVALLIVLGWSVLALGGALPLYLINTPCNANFPSAAIFEGGYSTLSDLSLLRLLRLLDSRNVTTTNPEILVRRAIISSSDPENARLRVVILTILVLLLGLLPALIKILREFNTVAEYRRRWIEVKCEGKDLAWISAHKAPGFVSWGEKQLKDYVVKIGLSSSLGEAAKRNGNDGGIRARNGEKTTRRREEEQPLHRHDDVNSAEVDIQSLFSIGDTHRLALLIDERDEILENLEIAETKYISSFRVTTPDPSILDFVPPPPADPSRPYISRPLPLGPPQPRRTRGRRHMNRAFGSSSFAPTSFVAPSSYYKLRGVKGVSGGKFAESGIDRHQSLSESINSRVIGSRFMEVNRNSVAYGRLPLGSHVAVEKDGELGPASDHGSWLAPIPDPRRFGPNYGITPYENLFVDEHGVVHTIPEQEEEEWVKLSTDGPEEINSDFNGIPPDQAGPSSFMRRPRPPKSDPPSLTRRETFPLRQEPVVNPDSVPPPHLRLQPSQPFVRPLEGLGFEDLGHVYAEITQWRSRLKSINAEIAEAQRESYNDIANGTNINGWLLVGKGLRFLPGVQMIEGRAKEDIRWDVLQNERTWMETTVMWAVILGVAIAMAAALTAAVGLALAPAPDVAHYIPFLQPLVTAEPIAAGLATILAPAVAATLFIIAGLAVIHLVATIHGSVSISGNQLLIFKITFFVLTFVGTVWIVAIGAILFSMQALNTDSSPTKSIANGAVYISVLCLALVFNVAVIFPACLLLQPFRLWHVLRAEKHAVTPRQRFRAVYPRTYNPSFAIGACVLAIVFASTFALIFPLIAPAVVLLLLLTLIAHRFLVGYVYARTHSQTGGLLQLWLLRRFGTLLSFQPILLGLIFLSREFWIEGGILTGTGVFVILFVEAYTTWKTRLPGRNSLSPITRNSLDRFASGADRYLHNETDTLGSSIPGTRPRGSMASVLEMMSLTLAVMPSSSTYKGPVPLPTESLDDLAATERAARTHPDAPPRLPPLPFTDHAEDMAGILYAPELIAPPPIIWLPNDLAGVAKSEAVDLQKYHDLQVTLDVRAKEDVLPRRSSSSRGSRQDSHQQTLTWTLFVILHCTFYN